MAEQMNRGQATDAGPLVPPPPPPDIRALREAAQAATAHFDALCLDPTASLDATMRAWDVAAAADAAYYTALRAQRVIATWQGVRPR